MNGIFDSGGNGEKVRCKYPHTSLLGGTATGERVHVQAIAARRRFPSIINGWPSTLPSKRLCSQAFVLSERKRDLRETRNT